LLSGGFGSPWEYILEINGEYHTQVDQPLFSNLPAGDYQTLVVDSEGCSQIGPLITITQPDSLQVEIVSYKDITLQENGSIVAAALGGTSPYTFMLLPDSLFQGSVGTFTFQEGDSGVYVVEVNDAQSCGPVHSDTVEIKDLTHVGYEELSDIALRMFPNPATDVFTLEMPMDAAEVSIEVLSLTGQVVYSMQAYPSGGVLRETIDVSGLAKGMYMLRVDGTTLKSGLVVN